MWSQSNGSKGSVRTRLPGHMDKGLHTSQQRTTFLIITHADWSPTQSGLDVQTASDHIGGLQHQVLKVSGLKRVTPWHGGEFDPYKNACEACREMILKCYDLQASDMSLTSDCKLPPSEQNAHEALEETIEHYDSQASDIPSTTDRELPHSEVCICLLTGKDWSPTPVTNHPPGKKIKQVCFVDNLSSHGMSGVLQNMPVWRISPQPKGSCGDVPKDPKDPTNGSSEPTMHSVHESVPVQRTSPQLNNSCGKVQKDLQDPNTNHGHERCMRTIELCIDGSSKSTMHGVHESVPVQCCPQILHPVTSDPVLNLSTHPHWTTFTRAGHFLSPIHNLVMVPPLLDQCPAAALAEGSDEIDTKGGNEMDAEAGDDVNGEHGNANSVNDDHINVENGDSINNNHPSHSFPLNCIPVCTPPPNLPAELWASQASAGLLQDVSTPLEQVQVPTSGDPSINMVPCLGTSQILSDLPDLCIAINGCNKNISNDINDDNDNSGNMDVEGGDEVAEGSNDTNRNIYRQDDDHIVVESGYGMDTSQVPHDLPDPYIGNDSDDIDIEGGDDMDVEGSNDICGQDDDCTNVECGGNHITSPIPHDSPDLHITNDGYDNGKSIHITDTDGGWNDEDYSADCDGEGEHHGTATHGSKQGNCGAGSSGWQAQSGMDRDITLGQLLNGDQNQSAMKGDLIVLASAILDLQDTIMQCGAEDPTPTMSQPLPATQVVPAVAKTMGDSDDPMLDYKQKRCNKPKLNLQENVRWYGSPKKDDVRRTFKTHMCTLHTHSLWATLPPDAMSGDETDHQPGQKHYAIMKLNW
ncbi:hypothetical protein EDC04DRAFT_2606936 [Pisolithus marmoratus]|nr:hypothetical protein EDC04DRAFT_2606936 [Pisolithus marmoratus]